MKLKAILFLLFTPLIASTLLAQNKASETKIHWTEVEIRVYQDIELPTEYNYTGEAILEIARAKSIDKLSQKQVRKIKENVAKYGACIVYVDFNNLMSVNHGLYYVWTNEDCSPSE